MGSDDFERLKQIAMYEMLRVEHKRSELCR